jgi:hypothetical protein
MRELRISSQGSSIIRYEPDFFNTQGSACMDETTRKELEKKYAALAEAMKPSPAIQKAIEEISKTVKNVPGFSLPAISRSAFRMPEIPRIPTQEEVNDYQSASVLMRALADEALKWKDQLPKNYKPAILAILYGGIQIHVQTLSQVSFHGIRVEGTLNGSPCSLLAHQSTVQLLCYAEEVQADKPRRPIGFIWENNKVEV